MNWLLHYQKLIDKRRALGRPEGYTEDHHILPECQGGPDISENRIRLTAREHFVAHQFLVKMNPGHCGLIWAAFNMSNNSLYGSREYAWLREKNSAAQSEKQKGRIVSKETRKKLSESKKGIPRSEETKKKMSENRKGILHSEETLKRMKESRRGIPKSEEHRKNMSKSRKGISFKRKII